MTLTLEALRARLAELEAADASDPTSVEYEEWRALSRNLARRFARHRAADPHCTCNDCVWYALGARDEPVPVPSMIALPPEERYAVALSVIEALIEAYAGRADWSRPDALHSAVRRAGVLLGRIAE